MKKLILIVIFSITISTYLSSQNSFPTSNAIWNETHNRNPNAYFERLWGLLGDTIINDTLYTKLYEFTDTVLSLDNIHYLIGGIRNEGEKVWFKPYFWTEPDILLYDFGAEVGDTVWHNGAFYDNAFYINSYCYTIVEEIETIDDKKIYQVVNNLHPYTMEWSEGIGCSNGLFMSISGLVMFQNPDEFQLNCFKHNDIVKYSNNSCNNCFCKWLVSSYIFEFNNNINIYPNPATDIINIEIAEDIKLKSLAVYSIDGKLIEKNRYSYNTGKLNISNLKKGSYILKLEADNIIYKKLIIKE